MLNRVRKVFALVITGTALIVAPPLIAETLIGSHFDSRVIIGFKTNPEAVNAYLPDGFSSIPLPQGPMKGSNLLIGIEDRLLGRDAEGNANDPSTQMGFPLLTLAKGEAGVRMFGIRVYTSVDGYDPLGNSVVAQISRTTSISGPANEGRARSDAWSVSPVTGGTFEASLNFTSGKRSWVESELTIYSNTDPDRYLISRYQQLVDFATSSAIGKPLAGEFSYTNSIPELEGLFDGNEEVIAIMDVPIYVREMFKP